MSKSSMLKEGMKGGLNGLLSSTKKPSKEQIVTETTPAPPVSVSETTEVPVHCNFLINKSWYLVDLPGYGYAKRGQKAQEQIRRIIESYILYREQLTCLFLLVDSRLAPQPIDLTFIEWLGENGIPFAVIFTKADKLSGGKLKGNIEAYLDKLSEQWEELPPYFVTSSENKSGREAVLDYIEQINKQLKKTEQ